MRRLAGSPASPAIGRDAGAGSSCTRALLPPALLVACPLVVLGWILTLVIVGSGVALVFASGVYAPTVQKPLELIVADAGR